jgi:hypothetical protein
VIVVVHGGQCLLLVVERSTSRVGEEIIVVEVAGMKNRGSTRFHGLVLGLILVVLGLDFRVVLIGCFRTRGERI